jgi:hypothetical protein
MHFRIALAASLMLTTPPAVAASYFNRIASFPVELNAPQAEESSSEIIAASEDGMLLVYSDSPAGGIGFIDIADPRAPKAAGFLSFGGEPTSVTIVGGKVIVAVNTRESYTDPSGHLAVVDLATKAVETTCELGGQPDSIAHDRARSLIAVAIENERDEDLNDGAMPQLPAGYLVVLDVVNGTIDCHQMRRVELSGLAEIAPEDPEPEFVDINDAGEVAVTLQENNHIVIVDGRTGAVAAHFSAGTADLSGIDIADDGQLSFSGEMSGVRREPDAIKWLDNDRLVVANEGDLDGGSRGFTIFSRDGTVLYESGAAMELEAARMGHYPDFRDSKGVEPEGLEVATFGDVQYIFVAQERSSLIAVYRAGQGDPEYVQSVASGISPEGLVAIPGRNLLATANEVDLRADGLGGSHVMVYELAEGTAAYPQLIADLDADGRPFGWAAISGAVADMDRPGILYAVSDSVLAGAPAIYTIDATAHPARITGKTLVTRGGHPAQKLDLEGITLDGAGGFWLASEGDTAALRPHALLHVNAAGEIEEEVAYPAELLAGETRSGAEGIALVGDTLWIAIQREWKDDDRGTVKLVSYTPSSKQWGAVRYALDAAPEGGWVGLSEITHHRGDVYVIERDNQIAGRAQIKSLYRVPVADLVPAALGGELPTVTKEHVRDLIPDLASNNGYVVDKVESFAIDATGTGYVVTDNDGVDDSSGETFFWSIGAVN